jgi:hypothetical protein
MNFKTILISGLAASLTIASAANAAPGIVQGGKMDTTSGQGQGQGFEVKPSTQPQSAVPHPAPAPVHPAPAPVHPGNGQQPAPRPQPAPAPVAPQPSAAPTIIAPVQQTQQQTQQTLASQQNTAQVVDVNAKGGNAAAKATGGNAENTIGIGTESTLTGANVNQGPITATSGSGGNNLINTYEAAKHPVYAPYAAPAAPAGQGSGYSYNSQNGMCSENFSAYAGLNSDSTGVGAQFFGFGVRGDHSNTRQQMTAEVRAVSSQHVVAIAANQAQKFGNRKTTTAGKLAKLMMRSAALTSDNTAIANGYVEIGNEMEHMDFANDCTPTPSQPVQPQPNPTGTPDWNGYQWPSQPTTPVPPTGSDN